ncbi:MAG: CHC2 zinc finger domain-containing protein [Waddliaceae bacterium]
MNSYRRLDAAFIKAAINPSDFYLQELNLCRFGYKSGTWIVAGLCPFHDDSRPGSFKINQETGAFKCWSCESGGSDIIAFLQQRDDLSFLDAIRKLSSDWRCR